MPQRKHYLVTGTSAVEVERLTGLRGMDTPLGVLVEEPPPFDFNAELAKWQRALNPRCCNGVVLHEPHCRFWNTAT